MVGCRDQPQQLLGVQMLDDVKRRDHVERSGRQLPEVRDGVAVDDRQPLRAAGLREAPVSLDAVRRNATIAQQREPLTATRPHIHDAARRDDLLYDRQVDGLAPGDLRFGAPEAVLERRIHGGEALAHCALAGLAPRSTAFGLQRRPTLQNVQQGALRLSVLSFERAEPRRQMLVIAALAVGFCRGAAHVSSTPISGRGMVRRTAAGTPATTVNGSTSCRTSEPTPTTAFSPIVQGPTTVTLLASQAPSPTTMSRPVRGTVICRSRPNLRKSSVPVYRQTLCPKKAYLLMLISPDDRLKSALLMTAVGSMWSLLWSP